MITDYDAILVRLGRAIRAGADTEVEQILVELGPRAVEALERLEDAGAVTIPSWGVDH